MLGTKKKMKFLATKLAALESELVVSREILQAAAAEVDKMFAKKYFPEIPVENEKQEEGEMEEFSGDPEEDHNRTEKQKREQQKQTSEQKQQNEAKETKSAEKNADPEVKKMFRKIASQCHPDKLQDMEDGFEKTKKQELYQKARKALEGNDIVLMANIASELDIDIPEISREQLKVTENKIMAIKRELAHIESTLVWQWFFTEAADKKDNILKQLFGLMYANNTRS